MQSPQGMNILNDVLKKQNTEKKKKYLRPCLEQRRSFVPFVVSIDGLIGREAKNLLKWIALRLLG
jgi:hypothetical protein